MLFDHKYILFAHCQAHHLFLSKHSTHASRCCQVFYIKQLHIPHDLFLSNNHLCTSGYCQVFYPEQLHVPHVFRQYP
jgi:hypothetical protein